MSPIDIVPVGHHHYDDHYMDETVMGSMGIIENKNAYHTGDSEIPTKDGSMSSLRHLKPPVRGGHRVVRSVKGGKGRGRGRGREGNSITGTVYNS